MDIPFATSTVAVSKTISEIETMLQDHGVEGVAKTFDESKRVKAIFFRANTEHGVIPVSLPVEVAPIYQLLVTQRVKWPYGEREKQAIRQRIHEQAERTAWRIIHWWLKSELALIELGMVQVTQVFLPYMLVGENETFYQRLQANNFKALTGRVD